MLQASQMLPALDLVDLRADQLLPLAWRELRRLAAAVALACLVTGAGRAEEKPAGAGELKSLHGTMITMMDEDTGTAMEIWAKGDNVRAEFSADKHKVITIQLGDTMYTFGTESKKGMKQRFTEGLARMGLIRQIATIKSKGKKQGSRTIDGVTYDQYSYDDPPHEWANVYLEAKTSLPVTWVSAVPTGKKKATAVKMRYRDMEANVEVDDKLFKLPQDVTFAPAPEEKSSQDRSTP